MPELCAGVFVIATTNKPWRIDSALLRPGRFGLKIFVPTPDETTRRAILSACTDVMPCNDMKDFHGLPSLSEGWSCAEVKGVYEEAARYVEQRISSVGGRLCVCFQDLCDAVHNIGPSMEVDCPNVFKDWALRLSHATI